MERSAGILLSITSLPSKYGIGCFSKEAYEFVDFLKRSGQTYWQILPIGPTSYGDSPYQSFSTFAGNPYFIDLEQFIEAGILTKEECDEVDFGTTDDIDYHKLYIGRYPLLKKAFKRSNIMEDPDFAEFVKQNEWLEDYSLFMAVKDKNDGVAWDEWDEDIKLRKPEALQQYKDECSEEMCFYKFLQYHFYKQWNKLKAYANENGVKIVGDIPIYVAFDSADVWASPQLFQINEDNVLKAVAGCPPDGFSADGQLWGNPLYDWDYHKSTGFEWWISRIAFSFKMYDVVRIDHFRGFDEYYSIPYGDKTAVNGHWEKGPGMDLFNAIEAALGKRDVIAEDLGFMTDTVRELVKDSGFPNMKVIEFAFDSRDSGCRNDYLPHNYGENCVAYTGTHDNQTIISWFDTISDEEKQMAREYLEDYDTPNDKINIPFINLIMNSKANLCIIPMQDYLGLDDSCRMNQPSTLGINWKWRVKKEALSDEMEKEILKITKQYNR